MSKNRSDRAPLVLEIDGAALPDAPSPAEAPPPAEPELLEQAEAAAVTRAIAGAGRSGGGLGLGSVLLGAVGTLILLWLGVTATDFIVGLMERHGWLGWIAMGLAGLTVLTLILIALREILALARLGRIEAVRDHAVQALEDGSAKSATAALEGLSRLYRGRAELEWAQDRLRAAQDDTPDVAARIQIAERELMGPLDARAESAVSRASRDVAAATALIPLAFVDVLAALAINLRMVREIAEIYGGRRQAGSGRGDLCAPLPPI